MSMYCEVAAVQVCDPRSLQRELQRLRKNSGTAAMQRLLLRGNTDVVQGQAALVERLAAVEQGLSCLSAQLDKLGDRAVDVSAVGARPRPRVGSDSAHIVLDWQQMKGLTDFGKIICNISVCQLLLFPLF